MLLLAPLSKCPSIYTPDTQSCIFCFCEIQLKVSVSRESLVFLLRVTNPKRVFSFEIWEHKYDLEISLQDILRTVNSDIRFQIAECLEDKLKSKSSLFMGLLKFHSYLPISCSKQFFDIWLKQKPINGNLLSLEFSLSEKINRIC